jgi:hypothetical protein
MKLNRILLALSGACSMAFAACTKDAIDQKPDVSIAVPSTISDYQQLLDGIEGGVITNAPGLLSYRTLGDYLSDELYANSTSYTTYFINNAFINGVLKWDKSMFSTLTSLNEWNNGYRIVLNANIALEGIDKITPAAGSQSAWNNVKGSALFIRGQMFYNLAQFWAKPYNAASAASDIGIVLRLTSNADAVSTRSTVQQTYDQILSDLKASLPLLPNTSSANTQVSKVRPSLAAAYGMLARTCLAMGDSVNTFKYADSALQLYSILMDFNSITSFTNFNAETVYTSVDLGGAAGSASGYWTLDSTLAALYDSTDLRKTLFITKNTSFPAINGYVFVGDYSGNYRFTGIAVDELLLMRAEASARLGNTAAAVADLNTLLVKRYKAGTYTPFTAATAGDALIKVITERRKELLFRGCRWTDLRRLNSDNRFAKILSRNVSGTNYTLPPGDSRYTLQVPDYVITAANGSIQQTP